MSPRTARTVQCLQSEVDFDDVWVVDHNFFCLRVSLSLTVRFLERKPRFSSAVRDTSVVRQEKRSTKGIYF